MVIYICNNCKKEFSKKSNFITHTENKKRPCNIKINNDNLLNPFKTSQNINKMFDIINKQDIKMCDFCDSTFTRADNLKRHLKLFCKSKKYYDELEKLKEKVTLMNLEVNKLQGENEKLKSSINDINDINKPSPITNTLNNMNNVNNNNNNNTNNFNVQLVQFGNENISQIDTKEALNTYINSTGANIVSNILKLTNFNKKYPQNHNICITDLSRELVKIYTGDKFITKKFKNIKEHILNKVVQNAYEIVKKIESDNTVKKNTNVKSKIKINNTSLKLIDGVCPEDIVTEEIVESLLITDENKIDEIVLTLEQRQKISHLESKQQGLIEIAYERLKDELYNGRTFL